jgi:integral membrane protein (TIGR00529 family)
MEFLLEAPAFVKVFAIFISTLVFYRIGLNLGLSILLHSILLALLAGTGLNGINQILVSFLQPSNYLLLVVILMLLFFTEALRHTKRMERTVASLNGIFSNFRFLLSSLPALVGLLPMPGGAIFSAPMVAALDTDDLLTPSHKTAINYWFRHIWEYWWPLYPGVILAIKYCGLPLGMFFLIQVPFTFVSVLGGYLFILRSISKETGVPVNFTVKGFHGLFATLIPIGILVTIAIVGSVVLPLSGISSSFSNLLSMPFGLLVALAFTFKTDFKAFKQSLKLFKSKSTWLMVLTVAGVLAFSTTLKLPVSSDGSTIVSLMRDEFIAMGIPLFLIIMIIPMISGAVTGIAVGFVGASFPLVFALLGNEPPLNIAAAATSLAYISGYIGMMMSPLHICFVVSNQYFKTSFLPVYKYIWAPLLLMFIASLVIPGIYFFVLK